MVIPRFLSKVFTAISGFFKDALEYEDSIKIEEGKTYELDGIVQIHRASRGKSFLTVKVILV